MQRAFLLRRRVTLATAFLALAAGCDRSEAGPDEAPVRYDLLAEFPNSECWFEQERIEVGRYVDRSRMTEGWSFPEHDRDENAAEDSWIWATELESELTFCLREVAPRRVHFWASAYLPEGGAGNPVEVRLNGDSIEGFVLGPSPREYALELPVESQRVGLNRLSFEFAQGHRPIEFGQKDSRFLSGCFNAFQFEIEDEGVLRRLRATRVAAPRGTRLVREGRAIEQASGSRLRYHLVVPEAAVFRADIGYVERFPDSPAAARFRLTAFRDGEPELALLDESRAWKRGKKLAPIEVPLDQLAGQVVALELRVSSEPGKGPLIGVWDRPRLTSSVPAPPETPPAPPAVDAARARLRHAPVVMILLDAFNPKFMSAYGGRAGLTPNLDRIAEEGVRFEKAFAHATYTISSVGAMLTGLPTWKHGVWSISTALPPSTETWTQRFAAEGYRTAGIVCNPNGSTTFGYERGFESFDDVYAQSSTPDAILAEETLPYLERVLDAGASDDRPLFLWLHIIEPHEPYDDSPEPWGGRFDPDYEGDLTGSTEVLASIRDHLIQPTDRDLEHLKAQYEEGIGYVDEVMARIRAELEEAGLLEEGILAVFSDHGEAFMETRRGERVVISHGSTVYDEMARVPLLVRLPDRVADLGARGLTCTRLAASRDLLTTLADLVGVAPPNGASVNSFASLLFDGASYGRRFLTSHTYSLSSQRFMPEFAIWGEGYKYIYASGGGDELYVMGEGEEHDLSDERPVLAAWMRANLRRELGFDPDTGDVRIASSSTNLDPETLDQMRALGYMR